MLQSEAVLWLFLIVGILASVLYFVLIREPDRRKVWLWWLIGLSIYVVIALIVCTIVYCNETSLSTVKSRLRRAFDSKKCVPPTTQCEQEARRTMDMLKARQITIDTALTIYKNDASLLQAKVETKAALEKAGELYKECAKLGTNACSEALLRQCDVLMLKKNDPELFRQWQTMPTTQSIPQVLNTCEAVAKT